MGSILFASDLDNTLLFSHRHRQPGDRCVELLNGAEQGFFTQETVDLLPQVVQRVQLLPVTTRSVEQYLRIQWPAGTAPRWALTANGAVLLRDGGLDRDWYAQSRELIRDYQGELHRILRSLSARPEPSPGRSGEEMYVDAAGPDPAAAARCATGGRGHDAAAYDVTAPPRGYGVALPRHGATAPQRHGSTARSARRHDAAAPRCARCLSR